MAEAERQAVAVTACETPSRPPHPLWTRRVTWSEAEYTEYLHAERRRFAWAMQRYAALTLEQASDAAVRRYPYEPSDAPYRGLIFHEEAWRGAMLAIHGERYWVDHPELIAPPPEYEALE